MLPQKGTAAFALAQRGVGEERENDDLGTDAEIGTECGPVHLLLLLQVLRGTLPLPCPDGSAGGVPRSPAASHRYRTL